MNQNTNEISFGRKIYIVLFILMPIINQYKFGSFTFMQLYSFFSCIIFFETLLKKENVQSKLFFYIIYVLIIALLSQLCFGGSTLIRLCLRLGSFVFFMLNFYLIFPVKSNLDFMKNVYDKTVYFVAVIFYLQYIFFFLFNKPFMFLIPYTTLNYNGGIDSLQFMQYTIGRIYTGYFFRPASVFIEPAFLSVYLLPYLALTLFSNKNLTVRNIFVSIITTGILILSTSSIGIMGSLLLWGFFFIKILREMNIKNLKIFVFFIPVVCIVIVYLINQNGVLTSLNIKLNELKNINESSSLTWRLLRGFECFKQIGILEKIFGCGYGNVSTYFKYIELSTIYDKNLELIDYMSGFFYMLCNVGIIGTIFLIKYFISMIKNSKIEYKIIFLCLLIILFTSANFDTDKYFFYLGFLFVSSYEYNLKNIKKGDRYEFKY